MKAERDRQTDKATARQKDRAIETEQKRRREQLLREIQIDEHRRVGPLRAEGKRER